jgi:glycosyltransferase involved in cell wall biosynthesis
MTDGTDSTGPPPLDVALLKNLPFEHSPATANRGGVPLPYRVDHLVRAGVRLHYTDLPHHRLAAGLHDPMVQTAALLPTLLRAPVTLAMFESSGHPWGFLRHHLRPARRGRFAVLSCWLPEVLADASPAELDRYRRAYDSVDRLFYFSRNQTEELATVLGLPSERLVPLAFGVDTDEFEPVPPAPDGPLLAVGRDQGRDWPTLMAALAAAGSPARVVCRADWVRNVPVPPNVEVFDMVDRATYRRFVADARAVLVVTHVLGYPTGQSVLLESMAAGRPCIVTDTPAMRDYVEPGRTALTVPPHDVDALAEVLRAIDRDEVPLDDIGAAARQAVERSFTAETMWNTVARELRAITGTGP